MRADDSTIVIVGGGLAGCEAAWQAAGRGVRVRLFEMKPARFSPAHGNEDLAELVCSNSLRGAALTSAVGILKEELRRLRSLLMEIADRTGVPAGGALAVDRNLFAAEVTAAIEGCPRIEVVREEVREIPSARPLVIASGPLTSAPLAEAIRELTGSDSLHFFDAISPIVDADSLDLDRVFRASRYGKGGDDYLNCPMTRAEYHEFVEALLAAEKVEPHGFERSALFEGCLPIEEMAERGLETLAYGPMKPVGLMDPRTGVRPHAVVQLRQDDKGATMYSLVGFQTRLKRGAQRRVLRMIPGLEGAEFLRYGSIHRNSFLQAPRLLEPTLQLRGDPDLLFAGQITGVEGYVESIAMGWLAGVNAARRKMGAPCLTMPKTTAIGALAHYISFPGHTDFQPMNVNFGLFPELDRPAPKKKRREILGERALADLEAVRDELFGFAKIIVTCPGS